MNILITNPGRRVYFLNFLVELKKKYKNLKIHVSNNDKYLPAIFNKKITNHFTPLARLKKGSYKKKIIQIVKKNKIKLILPLTDHDILILASLKKFFRNYNCEVAVPELYLTKILNSKKKSYFFCKKKNILTPEIFKNKGLKAFNKKNVLVEKEIFGSASKNINIIKKNKLLKVKSNFLYQEYIKGTELHFDILNDFQGNYITSCVKRKLFIKNGETDVAQILIKKEYTLLAKNISKKIGHIGNLDCDAIVDNKGNIFFIDFNPRFGGGYPFTHLAGNNFLEILINLIQKKKIKKYKLKKVICCKSIDILKIKNEK